jgi:hypothetical protein
VFCHSGAEKQMVGWLCLTRHAADAGAMPRTACYLVNGKGFGDPRQRG